MNKILIVDDDEIMKILYTDELTEEGYDVITAGDGLGLLGLIEKALPDVVVLDIRLGDSNGLDLLQDIRNTYYELPVILCSAYSAFKYDPKSIAADYFVVKSSDFCELKVKIKMALENRKQFLTGPMVKDAQERASHLQTPL